MGDPVNKLRISEPLPVPVAVVGWVWKSIIGILGVGFFAWAGVVWNATELVKAHGRDMIHMQEDIDRLQADIDKHQDLDAHPGAKALHAQEQRQIDDLQRQIDGRFAQINAEVQALRSREDARNLNRR